MTNHTVALEPVQPGRRSQARELLVLGTAAQVPTRARNHNGYFVRWVDHGILFDPGEGTQRQLLLAGVSSSAITDICITHFHGDHCLGLPGVLARFALDQRTTPVDIYFPAAGQAHLERLRAVAAFEPWPHVRLHPLAPERSVTDMEGGLELVAEPLRHRVDTLGWRVDEPARRHVIAQEASARGVTGPQVGRLVRDGIVAVDEGAVRYEDVSELRPGRSFAFVMDTATCDAAVSLAGGADMVLSEATYLEDEAELAARHGHLTARQAAWIAREAGAGSLVLTHFSQRHPDETCYADEARPVFFNVVAARDLTAVAVPDPC
jgi:ribonuclease Z